MKTFLSRLLGKRGDVDLYTQIQASWGAGMGLIISGAGWGQTCSIMALYKSLESRGQQGVYISSVYGGICQGIEASAPHIRVIIVPGAPEPASLPDPIDILNDDIALIVVDETVPLTDAESIARLARVARKFNIKLLLARQNCKGLSERLWNEISMIMLGHAPLSPGTPLYERLKLNVAELKEYEQLTPGRYLLMPDKRKTSVIQFPFPDFLEGVALAPPDKSL